MRTPLLLLAGLLLGAGAAKAAVAPPPLGFDGLELRLETDQTEWMQGEPIVLYATLTNRGAQAAGVLQPLEPEAGYVKYTIVGPAPAGGPFLPAVSECSDQGPVSLGAGASLRSPARIFYGQRGWVFPQPGTYRVTATYLNRVRSNELTLQVVASRNANDQAAAQVLLGSPEAQRFLYLEGGDHLTQGRADLESIANQQADSALAGYASFALGANLSHEMANFVAGRVRPADLPAANAHLERARLRLPNSLYFSVGILKQLQGNYRSLNDAPRAQAVETQLRQEVQNRFPVLAPHVLRIEQRLFPQLPLVAPQP
jgi:hypothetical protein